MIEVLSAAVVFLGWVVYQHHLTNVEILAVATLGRERDRLLFQETDRLAERIRALELITLLARGVSPSE